MARRSRGLIVAGLALAGLGAFAWWLLKAQATGNAQAFWILPGTSGTYVKSVTFIAGFSEMRLSTQVPQGTPVRSVQAFIDGAGGAVHPWDPATTGYNYIIDFGIATTTLIGTHTAYTLTILTDGRVLKSDTITATVIAGGGP